MVDPDWVRIVLLGIVLPLAVAVVGSVVVLWRARERWSIWVLSGLWVVGLVGILRAYAFAGTSGRVVDRPNPGLTTFSPEGGPPVPDLWWAFADTGRVHTPVGLVDASLLYVPALLLVLVGALSGRRRGEDPAQAEK